MLLHSFKYSLKVWLTSVAVTPLLFVITSFSSDTTVREGVYKMITQTAYLYGVFFIFELLFSFVTWVIFLIVIQLTVINIESRVARCSIISVAGVMLAAGTFRVILAPFEGFNITSDIWVLCTCFCIGAGSWFYRLEPKPEQEDCFNENIILNT